MALVGVGRDDSAESSRLLRSGEQVDHALQAIDVIEHHLPHDRAALLAAKARDRIAAYALDVARQYLERSDGVAALANLRAAVSGRPTAKTLRLVSEVLQGVDRAFKG